MGESVEGTRNKDRRGRAHGYCSEAHRTKNFLDFIYFKHKGLIARKASSDLFICLLVWALWDRDSLCSTRCPRIHCVSQEQPCGNPPASASWVWELTTGVYNPLLAIRSLFSQISQEPSTMSIAFSSVTSSNWFVTTLRRSVGDG